MHKVGVLALQGASQRHVEALSALGAHAVEVRTPEDLSGVEGLVLPGGESTTMSRLLDLSGLFQPIAERLGDGMPAFGTCAGLILLSARILDGRPDQRSFGILDVDVRRNAFGRQVDSFETELAVAGLGGGPVPAVFIRAPVIERVGEGVEVLASVPGPPGREGSPGPPGREGSTGPPGPEGRTGRAVLCRQGSVLAAAFHPELSDDLRLHQTFLEG